jgi:hypothetical protein
MNAYSWRGTWLNTGRLYSYLLPLTPKGKICQLFVLTSVFYSSHNSKVIIIIIIIIICYGTGLNLV